MVAEFIRKREAAKAPGALKTISEVAEDLNIPAHVLRFWEQKFPHLSPLKRRGGRRYYRPEDIDNIRFIRKLLYVDGYTIKGAIKFFAEKADHHSELLENNIIELPVNDTASAIRQELELISRAIAVADPQSLRNMLQSLRELRLLLKQAA